MMRKLFLPLLLLTTLSIQAAKQTYDLRLDGIYYRIDGKRALVAKGDEPYLGDVVIPDRIESTEGAFDVTGIDAKAFYGSKAMTSVTYPASITSIGENAFQNCEGLKQFTISEHITFIAGSAFENAGLEQIVIPASVSNIGDRVFRGCKALKSAVILNKSIGEEQFTQCSSLENVTISENVTTIKKKAFARCTRLGTITIPQSAVKVENEIFSGCDKLENAVVLNETIAEKQFSGCKMLSQLTLSEALTMIDKQAFAGCEKLEAFRTPAKLQIIEDEVFLRCTSLAIVELGNSLTHIGKKAFAGSLIEQIVIPASVKTFGEGAFQNCKNLKRLELHNAMISESEFQGCIALSEIVFEAVPFRIAKNAFNGCVALTALELPEGVSIVDNNAFHGCKGIERIVLPASIEQIGSGAFSGCPVLRTIRCLAVQVPAAAANAFSGIAKDGLRIEVPAESVEPYKLAAGWKALQPKEGQVFFPIE